MIQWFDPEVDWEPVALPPLYAPSTEAGRGRERASAATWETWAVLHVEESEVRDLGGLVVWLGSARTRGGTPATSPSTNRSAVHFLVRGGGSSDSGASSLGKKPKPLGARYVRQSFASQTPKQPETTWTLSEPIWLIHGGFRLTMRGVMMWIIVFTVVFAPENRSSKRRREVRRRYSESGGFEGFRGVEKARDHTIFPARTLESQAIGDSISSPLPVPRA